MSNEHGRASAHYPGYRLERLELYNWGTFDSSGPKTRGHVYRLVPDGRTTLLIGKNGSGKSTVVDALLTLLVRPAVRNYNVAAGAKKRERDERTYIKGAYDRRSDEENRAAIQYLREQGRTHSVLLASFRHLASGEAFTLAQVLYLSSDGRAEKVYCFAKQARTIAEDFADLRGMDRLLQQLRGRGFRVTRNYSEYHEWFCKVSGVRPKAMDMFNQTVAVKDIQRLNDFIRSHMLEPRMRDDDIGRLLQHYDQLNEAHESLLRVRKQEEMLRPIETTGNQWQQCRQQVDQLERMLQAAEAFLSRKIIEVFEPRCEELLGQLHQLGVRIESLAGEISREQDEMRRLQNQIEQAGGDRLREIPLLIRSEQSEWNRKRDNAARLVRALRQAGIEYEVNSDQSLRDVRELAARRVKALEAELEEWGHQHEQAVIRRGELRREQRELAEELRALQQRRENLPRWLAEVRQSLCEDLGIARSDLVFAAELMAVDPSHRDWEASIELVLRDFALSLLVPDRFYRVVSDYIERTRLRGARGDGVRLVYLRIGQRKQRESDRVPPRDSLIRKLQFRDGHPLLPWLHAELLERFDYRCCQTIDEFQLASGAAMTRERHIKNNRTRHLKDDRERVLDRRHFVLGWDNAAKRHYLKEELAKIEGQITEMDQRIARLERLRSEGAVRRHALVQLEEFTQYSELDFARHAEAIERLELERRRLEEGSEVIQQLKVALAECESRASALGTLRDDAMNAQGRLAAQHEQMTQVVERAKTEWAKFRQDPRFGEWQEVFGEIETVLREGDPITAENLLSRCQSVRRQLEQRRQEAQRELEPLQEKLGTLMGKFLARFPQEQSDLQPSPRCLDGFLGLLETIRREDLPRHADRFKERLNDKVTREIGRLHGELLVEHSEIEDKVTKLNEALRQVPYRAGTHMRLETRPVRDREILDFRQSLKSCLDESFDGSFEADEARFVRIKRFIDRLREEERWRRKVTDVRRWLDFAAREIDDQTGEERGYYEDSSGQSGGEKAKLAFTILVAAIAYQYNIDPEDVDSDRFHFVVVDEMFSKVDDVYAEYALRLFERFGLQLLIVAPFDAKARVTDGYVQHYVLVTKDEESRSQLHSMTAKEFEEGMASRDTARAITSQAAGT